MAAPECSHAEDVAAYALGALDPAAETQMASHIESCARCRAQLGWLGPALETIPESVEQLEPPARLRSRLMEAARVEAEPQPAKRAGRDRRLRIGRFALAPATALVCAVLIVQITVAVLAGYLGDDNGSSGRTVPVAAGPAGSKAELELGGGQATFVAQRMPRLSHGDVYQVWVRLGTKVVPSASFRPSSDGSAAASVPQAAEGADQVMVTREPRSSLPPSAPTSPPIYTATLSG